MAVVAESEPVETPEVEVVADAPVEDAPVNDLEIEESSPDLNAEEEAPEPVGDEQTTPESPLSLDEVTSIAQLRELKPELAKQLEYAGEQRREAELRKEAGSAEATAERIREFRRRSGITEEAASDADINFLDKNNYANAYSRVLTELTEGWTKSYEPTAEDREVLNTAAASGDLVTYAKTVLHTAAMGTGRNAVFDMTADQIPPDSKLGKSITAREARLAAAESKAAEIEAKSTNGKLPETSTGGPIDPASQADPASSFGAASRAFNESRITAAEFGELAKKFEIKV
jgi:hypothetical protein